MKQQNRQRQMAQQRRQAKRRQRAPMSHPTGPAWLKGDLESQTTYAMLSLYYGGHSDEAVPMLRDLKRRYPAHPLASFLPVYAELLKGNYSADVVQAWRRSANRGGRHFPQPMWDGSPMPDGRLLVWWPDWGYGDTIQWARLLAPTKAQFQGHVTFEVRPGLSRLMRGLAGADEIIEPGPPGAYDWQIPQDLLLTVLELTPAILEAPPYLTPDPLAVDRWRPTFANPEVLHVGLHWQAESGVRWAPARSVPLDELAILFDVPGVRFYSLQPGADLQKYPKVHDLGGVDQPEARFCETAAILTHMDILIACDSSVAHLAGAMARPCWALIGLPCDAQWGTSRQRAPFYPTHEKYVQQRPGEWTTILQEMTRDLSHAAWEKRLRR